MKQPKTIKSFDPLSLGYNINYHSQHDLNFHQESSGILSCRLSNKHNFNHKKTGSYLIENLLPHAFCLHVHVYQDHLRLIHQKEYQYSIFYDTNAMEPTKIEEMDNAVPMGKVEFQINFAEDWKIWDCGGRYWGHGFTG